MYSFGPGRPNQGKDFFVRAFPEGLDNYKYLIFSDSKGCSSEGILGDEWIIRLSDDLNKRNISHVLISRPKDITVFFSLVNFINNNGVSFNSLVTNLGFVDTTPKKQVFIDDIISQTPIGFNGNQLKKVKLCNYKLNDGNTESLYSLNYDGLLGQLSNSISSYFHSVYLLEVIEFNPNINIARSRPAEFFSQLKIANALIKRVSLYNKNIKIIKMNSWHNIPQEHLSYDAVHFTPQGHGYVLGKLIEGINL